MTRILKKALLFVSLLGLAGVAGPLLDLNSTPVQAQEQKARAYFPRLADLMNSAIQIHHTKLWFAGRATNWVLAGYEAKKIKETIEEIKEAIVDIQNSSPQWRQVPVGEMLSSFDSKLASVRQAIEAKDAAKFNAAYLDLTATCNACHASAGQSQIKIIVPASNDGGAFADQDFTNGGSR
jgi:hypothetical protein